MENFISKIKKTTQVIKQAPVNLHKEFIKKTSLGLDRSIPQPNPMDNTIDEVKTYYDNHEVENNKTPELETGSVKNSNTNDINLAA